MAAPQPQAVTTAHPSAATNDVKHATPMPTPTLQTQPPPPPLPAGWFEMKDPSGRNLYFHAATNKTSWQRPVVRQLPPGWIKAQTPDGRPVFVHTATQQCSFQWPKEEAVKPAPPAPAATITTTTKPQLARYTTTPAKPAPPPAPHTPQLIRSSTAPATAPTTSASSAALMTMSLSTTIPRKAIPGLESAHAIHQLSSHHNSSVLSQRLTADVAHASGALKDTTITAASLATRQAKAVGSTMVSATKMQQASKKAIVHTGALGVKIGRASKGLMQEMVEAADGKRKYRPKARRPLEQGAMSAPAQQKISGDAVHGYEYEQPLGDAFVQQVSPAAVPAKPLSAGVPARKPITRPSVSVSFNQHTAVVSAQSVAAASTPYHVGQNAGPHVQNDGGASDVLEVQQTLQSPMALGKPSRPSFDVSGSLNVSAQGSLALSVSGQNNELQVSAPAMATDPSTCSLSQPLQAQQQHTAPQLNTTSTSTPCAQQHVTPGAPATMLQANPGVSATLTYQSQVSTNPPPPPPPYSPPTQTVGTAPAPVQPAPAQQPSTLHPLMPYQAQQYTYAPVPPTVMQQQAQPVQQPQYVMVDSASQQQLQQAHPVQQQQQQQQYLFTDSAAQQPPPPQQQQQQIVIQQQSPDSSADAYRQASSMMAMQQQMQALQMQQQVQQMQGLQQQQAVEQPVLYQQQPIQQQQQQQQMVPAVDQEVYFVDDPANTTVVTSGAGAAYQQQQEQQYAFVDSSGTTTMYAQETSTEEYATDGSMVIVEETAVYGQDADGDVIYAEEFQVYEVEAEPGAVDAAGFEEVDCCAAEADCDFGGEL